MKKGFFVTCWGAFVLLLFPDLLRGGEEEFSSRSLIPRKILFGNPSYAQAKISPDGTQISYLAPRDGVLNVYVAPVEEPEKATPVTHDTKRGIRAYFWSYDNQLLYLQDKGGTEDWVLHRVHLQTLQDKALTPSEKVQVRIFKLSPLFPHEVIVGLNQRDPRFHDLYRLELRTGQLELFFKNVEFTDFDIDDHFQLRLAARMEKNGDLQVFKFSPRDTSKRDLFMTVPVEDVHGTQTLGFNKKGDILYLLDSREGNTAVLKTVSLETGQSQVRGSHEKADVSHIFLHPETKELQGYGVNYLRRNSHFFDLQIEQDYAYLQSFSSGDVQIISRDLKDKLWIVAFEPDDGPVSYYIFDRLHKKMKFLFFHRPELSSYPLASMHPLVLTAQDGVELPSYLTLPVSSDPQKTGRPCQPLPLVLMVHGGPHARDRWGYDPQVQWLTNRGYAVLQVNYRGSRGFGKDFIKKSQKEYGGKMHQDLIDVVQWAVKERIADPQKVAIYGGSYGGYAALCGITLTPDVFACAIDCVGISNLQTMMENFPPYWIPYLPLEYVQVGDPRTPEGRAFLKERSPLTHVDRIKKPLLVAHGDNDPRVKRSESDQIVEAMKRKGIPVTYLRYPDEGHGFARPENRLTFYGRVEKFLARFLGGACEPLQPQETEGSSLIVQEES